MQFFEPRVGGGIPNAGRGPLLDKGGLKKLHDIPPNAYVLK